MLTHVRLGAWAHTIPGLSCSRINTEVSHTISLRRNRLGGVEAALEGHAAFGGAWNTTVPHTRTLLTRCIQQLSRTMTSRRPLCMSYSGAAPTWCTPATPPSRRTTTHRWARTAAGADDKVPGGPRGREYPTSYTLEAPRCVNARLRACILAAFAHFGVCRRLKLKICFRARHTCTCTARSSSHAPVLSHHAMRAGIRAPGAARWLVAPHPGTPLLHTWQGEVTQAWPER